jgi:hypothetical protein
VIKAVDENPSAMSVASVRLEHGYDQSGVAVARVPARSPRPPHPPESALSALLVGAAAVAPAMTPPEAEDPQQEDIVVPS